MFDPTINTLTVAAGSFKHLRTRKGMDTCKTVTLDITKFTQNTHYPNFFIPGGVALGKLASGLYGPYSGETSEVQRITVDATGGTFTISFRGGTTAAIAFNATAAQVQAALELLSEVGHNDIIVSGGPGNAGGTTPYVLTFSGQYVGQDVAAVTTAAGSLTGGAGTAAVSTTTAGGAGVAVDGTQTATGLLFDRAAVLGVQNRYIAPAVLVVPMQVEGDVITANLPIAAGTAGGVDAAAQAQLGSRWTWS